MSTINDGGPAFPVSTQDKGDGPPGDRYGHQDGPSTWQFPGLTIRDYFAAHFMERAQSLSEYRDGGWDFENAAQCAYGMADAMLKVRQQ